MSKWVRDAYTPSPENEEKLVKLLGLTYTGANRRDVRLFHERNMSAFLKGKFSAGYYPEAAKALSYAKLKHERQYRKPTELKIPFINHPLTMACHALAMGLEDDVLLAALLFHDVCEDCGDVPSDLPVCSEAQEIVALVTKPKPFLSERSNYHAIMDNPKACLVKCIDRCNNLCGMATAFSMGRMHDYIEETEKYYP